MSSSFHFSNCRIYFTNKIQFDFLCFQNKVILRIISNTKAEDKSKLLLPQCVIFTRISCYKHMNKHDKYQNLGKCY